MNEMCIRDRFYTAGEFQGNGWSLVVCFLPRILTGTFAGLTYTGLSRVFTKLRARPLPDGPEKPGVLAKAGAFFRNKAGDVYKRQAPAASRLLTSNTCSPPVWTGRKSSR